MADVLFGTVSDNVDPEGLGRVSVSLSDHGEEVVLPWIRVVQPMASADSGMVWIPEIDDNVVVLAGNGGVESMVVLGALYSGNRKPAGEAKVDHKHWVTKGGNTILLDDTEGSERIEISTKDTTLSIVLDQATPEIIVTAGDNLTINAEAAVTVNCTDLDVVASGTVTLGGDSKVVVDGGAVEIKSSGTVKISGSSVALG